MPRYVNPKVPKDLFYGSRKCFSSVPWFITAVGLTAKEIGYYVFQYLNANDAHDISDAAGNKLSHEERVWRGYRRMKADLKLGGDAISRINQLFENSGLWRIDRPNNRKKALTFTNQNGEQFDITTSIYSFAIVDGYTHPELLKTFYDVIAEERETLDQFYKQNRGKLRPRKGRK
jgi:hypothetical protein